MSTAVAADRPDLALPTSRGRSERLYLPVLESLRGWAILFVVLFHIKGLLYGDIALAVTDSWLWTTAYVGNTGVTLFFVLSGFLLSLPFLIGLRRGETPSLTSFYAARALRILPLYWLAIAVAWIDTHDTLDAVRALFFVWVGFAMHPHSLPWWSLSTEVQFYLLLPVSMLLARTRQGRWLLAGGVLAWLAVYVRFHRLEWWLESMDAALWRNTLFGRAPNFMAGIAAAWLFSREDYHRVLRRTSGRSLFAVACGAGLAWMLYQVALAGPDSNVRWPHWHIAEGALWSALLLASLHSSARIALLWDNAAMRRLGRISYGLFLFHLPLLSWFLRDWSYRPDKTSPIAWDAHLVGGLVAGCIACLVVSTILHHAVEMPCQRLRRRLAPTRARARSPESPGSSSQRTP